MFQVSAKTKVHVRVIGINGVPARCAAPPMQKGAVPGLTGPMRALRHNRAQRRRVVSCFIRDSLSGHGIAD